MNWQPIETAPKDGRRILATDGRGVGVVMWVAYQMVRPAGRGNGDWTLAVEDGEPIDMPEVGPADFLLTPTHWMPLPEPPKAG